MKKTEWKSPALLFLTAVVWGRCVRGTERGDGLCWPVYV